MVNAQKKARTQLSIVRPKTSQDAGPNPQPLTVLSWYQTWPEYISEAFPVALLCLNVIIGHHPDTSQARTPYFSTIPPLSFTPFPADA